MKFVFTIHDDFHYYVIITILYIYKIKFVRFVPSVKNITKVCYNL